MDQKKNFILKYITTKINKLIERAQWEIEGIKFLLQNISEAKNLPSPKKISFNEYQIDGLKPIEIKKLRQIHKTLRNGRELNLWRTILYIIYGKKLITLAKDKKNEIVGFQMLYFKKEEIKNKTIHEAFIGIKPEHQNKSLATNLRLFSARNLKRSRCKKISSKISKNNQASLESAIKCGFEPNPELSTETEFHLTKNLQNENRHTKPE